MDPMNRILPPTLLLAIAAPAQERLWEVFSLVDAYTYVATFGDFDHDGVDDVLTICWPNFGTGWLQAIRILSGLDGSVLQERVVPYPILGLVGVGDFDRDGYLDYAVMRGSAPIEVWSPHLQRPLMQFQAPPGSFEVMIGGGDLDGDSLSDIVIASGSYTAPAIFAYDHYGNLLYSTSIAQWSVSGAAIARGGAFVGDQDGDGCDDFVIGIDWWNNYRGVVILVSGRTGTILRATEGEQPGDRLAGPIAAAGDLDRDGKIDYAVGNYFGGPRSLINVYSGATGTMLRQWISTTTDIGARFLCGPDVDLDGIPDVISGSGNFVNATPFRGRVQAFSSLDQQVLAYIEPYQDNYRPEFAASMASLGVQPGNPYPVIAFTEVPTPPGSSYRRIQTWRLSPPGTRVVGTGCSTRGQPPTIGLRRVTSSTGETCRITLGSTMPSALAWCAIGPATPIPPFSLAPLGFPGCDLLVAPIWFGSRTTAAAGIPAGYAGIDIPRQLPRTQTSTATSFAAQWLVLDPTTLDYAASPRHEFGIL